jgi:hypothetical protein
MLVACESENMTARSAAALEALLNAIDELARVETCLAAAHFEIPDIEPVAGRIAERAGRPRTARSGTRTVTASRSDENRCNKGE